MSFPSVSQLKRAIEIQQKIDRLESELSTLLNGSGVNNGVVARAPRAVRKKRRKLSADARARIAAGQKRRWAKQKAGK